MKQFVKDKIFKVVADVASDEGVDVYVIGGYVRDCFLDRTSKDIDFVVTGNGITIAEKVSASLGKGSQVSVFKTFGTAMIHYKEWNLEFVGARKESYSHDSRKPKVETGSLADDFSRRDFTINAMAISLNKADFGELVDPFNGREDLKSRILKTPLDPDVTFSDDPLRMMRAIRFASQLNFKIPEVTFKSIARNKNRISIISKERITDELNKIIASPVPSKGFILLEECGLLKIIFPQFQAMKGVDVVDNNAHKDNFYHTLQVVDKISLNTDNLWLRWAALLHDIAKPVTKRYAQGFGWTFHGHETKGAKMVFEIFKNFKLPLNEKMKYVQKLVQLHLRPIVLSESIVTDSAVRRLLFEAGDDIDDLMLLCEADITSKNSKKVARYLKNFEIVRSKLLEIEEKDRLRNWQPPVSGEMIMESFGIGPSREVGLIKTAIREAILDGNIENNYEAAYKFMLDEGKKLGLNPK